MRRILQVIILVGFLSFASLGNATECIVCNLAQKTIDEIMAKRLNSIRLKERNQEAIEKLKKNESSAKIKFISNLFMLNLKIETYSNEIQFQKKLMVEKKCKECGFNI